MNEPDGTPNWEIAKKFPIRFFCLEDDATPKDLKRAYNRLIKKYKPEHSPNEFKIIREAYETASEWIRYGIQNFSVAEEFTEVGLEFTNQKIDRQEIENDPKDSGNPELSNQLDDSFFVEDQSFELSSEQAWFQQHKDLPEHEQYRRIKFLQNKTAQQYLYLAVLSDEENENSESEKREIGDPLLESFEGWILQGLGEFPEDPNLQESFRLAKNYAATPSDCEHILLLAAKILSGENFYFFTEGLWVRYLGMVPFLRFKEFLQECENHLGLVAGMAQTSFYLHILRSVVWKADSQWINSKIELCDENYLQLPSWAQSELDWVTRLAAVSNLKNLFQSNSETGKLLFKTIKRYFTTNQDEGAWNVHQFQRMIIERGPKLTEDFPLKLLEESWGNAVNSIWKKCSEEVDDYLGFQHQAPSFSRADKKKITDAMERMDIRYAQSWQARMDNYINTIYLWFLWFVCFVPVVVCSRIAYHLFQMEYEKMFTWFPFGALWAVLGGAAFLFVLIVVKKFDRPDLAFNLCHSEFISLIRNSNSTPEDLASTLREMKLKNLTKNELNSVAEFVEKDFALALMTYARKNMTSYN